MASGIKTLFIDQSARNDPETRRFVDVLGVPVTMVDNNNHLYQHIKTSDDPQAEGKQTLFITHNKSTFLKECPGTRDYLCCGYKILHIGSYCTMDCSYCILQSYFHPPVLQYFTNHEALFAELSDTFSRSKNILRIGTGEFTDSLIWEPWSGLTPRLVTAFAGQRRAVLELKTKTTAINRLKDLDHKRKTIVSWSLNTPRIIASEERRTAKLSARLRAAAKCQQWGYPLAFHFDPMVIYPGCEAEYRDVLTQLFASIDPSNIVWISMGTFRFMPGLKRIVEKRFPRSTIVYGEFVPGLDGKMRYFKKLRIALYRHMADWINAIAPQVTVYLCMEDDQVWRNSIGFSPASEGGLSAMLDRSAQRHCDLA